MVELLTARTTRLEKLRRSFLRGGPAKYAASPPTITMGTAGSASTITSSTTPAITPANPAIATISTLLGTNGSRWFGAHLRLSSTLGAPNATGRGWGQAVITDSDKIDVKIEAASGQVFRMNVRVDGEMYSTTDVSLTGDNTLRHVLVDFGSAKPEGRLVEFFFNAAAFVYGYNVTANRRVWKPVYAGEPNVMIYGDSYTDGVGSTNVRRTMAYTAAAYMGISNIVASAVGGTGYITASSYMNFLTRIDDLSRLGALDLLVVPGGINDNGNSAATVQAAVETFWSAAMAAQPNAIMACIGNFRAPSLAPTQAHHDAIRTGFLNVYDPKRMFFVNTYQANSGSWTSNDNWQSGTGDDGTPTGDGNADFYIRASDRVHPNEAGHEYLGRKLAAAVRSGVEALAA